MKRDVYTSIFKAPLFTMADVKQPKCLSIDEWNHKTWSIHTTEYYSVLKRKEILTHATTWMNLEDTTLSGTSQSQKGKYRMIPFT